MIKLSGKGKYILEKFIKKFDKLNTGDLYEILKARVDVFIIEQECAYGDIDNKDQECIHFYYKIQGEIAAYLRILPAGLSFKTPSMGRILVKKEYRGKNYGRELVKDSLEYMDSVMKCDMITISAQEYLKDFYESFGFKQISEVYLEDGIPHMNMERKI